MMESNLGGKDFSYKEFISVSDYNTLREAVKWGKLVEEQAQQRLMGSAYVVGCYYGQKIAGCARIIWDGGYIAYLADVMVMPEYQGEVKQILTFGPISILPVHQRKGYAKVLLEHSFQKALELGYDVIVIFGNPDNYVSRGFKSCKKYNICLENGTFPAAMLVKELKQGVFDGRMWYFHESPVYNIDNVKAQEFDKLFEPKEKKYKPSQEEFYIHSHSVIQ